MKAAIAAGIVQTKGAVGLTVSNLQSNAGFTGATGPFRFTTKGKVERRFSIYKVTSGVLKLHDAALNHF